MKKLFSLLLALIMLLSLFAACGEKPVISDGGEDSQPQSGDNTDAQTDPADDQTAAEEPDKETMEIITTTGDVSVPSSVSSARTSSGTFYKPGEKVSYVTRNRTVYDRASSGSSSQGSSSGSQQGSGTSQNPSQGSTVPQGSSASAAGALKPASGVVSYTPEWNEEYNFMVFSDGFTIAYNMGDIMVKLAESDGIKLKFPDTPIHYDNIGTDNTYNFYELFNWDGTKADSKITSIKSSKLKPYLDDPANNKVDFFLDLVSRDRGISIEAGRGRNATATEYFTKALIAAQPNAKTVLLAPSGYSEGNDGALIKKIGLDYNGLAAHNKAIHENADLLLSKTSGKKSAVYVCDAFDYFIENYSSTGIDLYDFNKLYPSMAGAYYTACVVYSSIFGRATSGIPFYGYIEDQNSVKILQEAADKYVSSTGVSLKAHTKTYSFRPMTLEQADPRNLTISPEYAHEKYPQYYNELLASAMAYYQRTNLVQYDNLNMDQARGTFSRREVVKNLSPEEATPQNILYSDCSAFTYACFVEAFDYDFNGITRSAPLLDSEELAASGCRVWYYDQSVDKRPASEISKEFLSVLQPGDLIDLKFPDGSGGHTMLYIGNGKMIHLTGRTSTANGGVSENYLYNNGTDQYEMLQGVLYDPVDYVAKPGEWLCIFGGKNYIAGIFRPLALGIKPTTQAKNRLNNLRNVVAYKHTTAPEGVSVNPGDDVTFTFIIRNIDFTAKTISITDKLPNGVTFKSGKDFTVSGANLSATVTVPAGGTVSVPYTVTIDKSVAPGTIIACHDAYLNGVRHNDTPIYVEKTFTDSQQSAVAAAADKAGASASSDFELVSKVYKDGFNITLPYTSINDALSKAFTWDIKGSKLILSQHYVAIPLFGGQAFSYSYDEKEPDRIRRITFENLIAGDIIVTAKDFSNLKLAAYIYLGNGVLATVKNGSYVKYTPTTSQMIMESLLSYSTYAVFRPSISA